MKFKDFSRLALYSRPAHEPYYTTVTEVCEAAVPTPSVAEYIHSITTQR